MNRRDAIYLNNAEVEKSGLRPSICGKAVLFRRLPTDFSRLRRRFSADPKAAAQPQKNDPPRPLFRQPAAEQKNIRRLFFLVLCISAASICCTNKPADLRTLVPADSLVYLETNDLAAALQPLADSKPFNDIAKRRPDFSALRGVQLAVAVTGFETSEEKLTEEDSVGHVQPHFVAVADTHAWNFQAVGFAETKLGAFVAEIYDSRPTLEKSDKDGGKYFTWMAADGRKAFALVEGSIIYFGNDASAIDKCLAVKRGEADSMAKTAKIEPASPGTLASGYVSTDGVEQIANIVGLKIASQSGDEPEIRSAVAGVLPNILRNSVTEIRWSASQADGGIEDKWQIAMPAETANVFSETMAAKNPLDQSMFRWIPADASVATLYNLKNPQAAWRSILLESPAKNDPLSGKILAAVADMLLEPYGIASGEKFFAAGVPSFVTANFSADGDKPVVVASGVRPQDVEPTLIADLRKPKVANKNSGLAKSPDGDTAAFFSDDLFVSGDASSVERIFNSRPQGPESGLAGAAKHNFSSTAAAVTIGHDETTASPVVELLSEKRSDNSRAVSTYFTETRFTKSGIERRTTSDFGFIGWIIAQIAEE